VRGRAGRIAATLCLAGIAALPARADARRALADFKAGRYLEAAAELQAIVDSSPGYAYGYFLLGHCMLKMSRPGDAEIEFRRAVELDPGRPEYYQGLALAMKAEADWTRTIQNASEGLARTDDPRTRYSLLSLRGYAWGALQRWSDAVRDLEAARALRADPWVLVMLGKAHFATGSFRDAVPPLREALAATPEDPVVLRLLAESDIRLAAGQPDATRKRLLYVEALEYAQRLTAVAPGELDAVNLVGRAALGAGRLPQAEIVFLHVLSRDPRHCYAMINLGRTYMAGRRWDEAEAFLRQAAACAPRLAAVHETMGELFMQRGMTREASIAFRRAEAIEPTTVPVSAPR